jgi:hypothetical protein
MAKMIAVPIIEGMCFTSAFYVKKTRYQMPQTTAMNAVR